MLSPLSRPESDPVACALNATTLFQPIVSTTSLKVHGFEALTRLPDGSGFNNVHDLLDAAFSAGSLRLAERALLCNSVERFAGFGQAHDTRLFCNIDNRLVSDALVAPEILIDCVRAQGLNPGNLCIETSERTTPPSLEAFSQLVGRLLDYNVKIAIDDFGRGFSGLETLLMVHPHYLKIDRLFVDGVSRNARQQAIVGKIIGLGHSLGLLTVAEGVETEADFRLLRELGCDFVQGYLIAKPAAVEELRTDYSECCPAQMQAGQVPDRIEQLMVAVAPLSIDEPLSSAVARFRAGEELPFLPVVDQSGHVHGAVFKEDLHKYLFGEYGSALLRNGGFDHRLERFLQRCPIAEATATPAVLVESFLVASGAKGMILTLDGQLAGVLSSQSILKLSWEMALEEAHDRNPLTSLPGNKSIARHIGTVLKMPQPRTIVFFDFDNFKCFNDVYGFGKGDRVIQQFAELLQRLSQSESAFVGHVGGDDFFASVPAGGTATCAFIGKLLGEFQALAEAHYTAEHRAEGGVWAQDRFGEQRFFPLLRASAVVLNLPASRSHLTEAKIISALARGKSAAKASEAGIHRVTLPETAVAETLDDIATWPDCRISGTGLPESALAELSDGQGARSA